MNILMINHLNMNGVGLVPDKCRINAYAHSTAHVYFGVSGSNPTEIDGELCSSFTGGKLRHMVCPGQQARQEGATKIIPKPQCFLALSNVCFLFLL